MPQREWDAASTFFAKWPNDATRGPFEWFRFQQGLKSFPTSRGRLESAIYGGWVLPRLPKIRKRDYYDEYDLRCRYNWAIHELLMAEPGVELGEDLDLHGWLASWLVADDRSQRDFGPGCCVHLDREKQVLRTSCFDLALHRVFAHWIVHQRSALKRYCREMKIEAPRIGCVDDKIRHLEPVADDPRKLNRGLEAYMPADHDSLPTSRLFGVLPYQYNGLTLNFRASEFAPVERALLMKRAFCDWPLVQEGWDVTLDPLDRVYYRDVMAWLKACADTGPSATYEQFRWVQVREMPSSHADAVVARYDSDDCLLDGFQSAPIRKIEDQETVVAGVGLSFESMFLAEAGVRVYERVGTRYFDVEEPPVYGIMLGAQLWRVGDASIRFLSERDDEKLFEGGRYTWELKTLAAGADKNTWRLVFGLNALPRALNDGVLRQVYFQVPQGFMHGWERTGDREDGSRFRVQDRLRSITDAVSSMVASGDALGDMCQPFRKRHGDKAIVPVIVDGTQAEIRAFMAPLMSRRLDVVGMQALRNRRVRLIHELGFGRHQTTSYGVSLPAVGAGDWQTEPLVTLTGAARVHIARHVPEIAALPRQVRGLNTALYVDLKQPRIREVAGWFHLPSAYQVKCFRVVREEETAHMDVPGEEPPGGDYSRDLD